MAAATTVPGSVAEQFSLLPKLMPNLDRHLLFPLLNFSSDEEAEQTPEQRKLLLALLSPTNMTDFVGDLFAQGLSRNGKVVLAAIGCGGTPSAYGLIETIPFAGGPPSVIVRGPCRATWTESRAPPPPTSSAS